MLIRIDIWVILFVICGVKIKKIGVKMQVSFLGGGGVVGNLIISIHTAEMKRIYTITFI